MPPTADSRRTMGPLDGSGAGLCGGDRTTSVRYDVSRLTDDDLYLFNEGHPLFPL